MVKLFSVAEMVSVEKEADASGLSYSQMMENAGKGIAEEIESEFGYKPVRKILALVGSGNNGGDALVCLAFLASHGWDATAYIVGKRLENDPLIARLIENKGIVLIRSNDTAHTLLKDLLYSNTILLDGVLGTGFKLPLKTEIGVTLRVVKDEIGKSAKKIHVVAVDCPSGIDCDTGEASTETIPAELTVVMGGLKTGLIKFPAASFTGKIRYASIGQIDQYPAYTNNPKYVLTPEIIHNYLPVRPINAHKGTFGTSLIIAGSLNYTGAALLAGTAAYRIGAGLVTMAVPEPLHVILSGQFPEATWLLLPHKEGVISGDAFGVISQNLDRATAILVGPGFGLENTTREFIEAFLSQNEPNNQTNSKSQIPLVVDADGLKLLSKINRWEKLLPAETVLTPHPGEMSTLCGRSIEAIQTNRIEIASQYAASWGCIIVLKGAFTIIAEPHGKIAVVPVATSALAKAGTGDVLAGLIVGLRAQGVPGFEAACAGAWIHANAGLIAADQVGNPASVLASDVVSAVPYVLTSLV